MRGQRRAGWQTTGCEGGQAGGNKVGTAVWDSKGREMKPSSASTGARRGKEKQEVWRPDKAQDGL